MVRPALVKLGGSVLTDKSEERKMRRPQARRLLAELAKADLPTVLFHGAGSYGHPPAARAGLGGAPVPTKSVAETMAAAGLLHAEVVDMAVAAGIDAVAVPVHLHARCEGDSVVDLPIDVIQELLDEGCTPVLSGTLLRGRRGWRVVSADELMAAVATEVQPRLGLFVTDVDGVFDRDPTREGACLLPCVTPETVVSAAEGRGADVTGRMHGKLARAIAVAQACPVLIVNGTVRGRTYDALRGKTIPCTRVQA